MERFPASKRWPGQDLKATSVWPVRRPRKGRLWAMALSLPSAQSPPHPPPLLPYQRRTLPVARPEGSHFIMAGGKRMKEPQTDAHTHTCMHTHSHSHTCTHTHICTHTRTLTHKRVALLCGILISRRMVVKGPLSEGGHPWGREGI